MRVVLLALGLALELYVIAVMPQMRISSRGRDLLALTQFGKGLPVAQGFRMRNDGLRAVDVQLSATEDVDLDVEYRLADTAGGGRRELFQGVRTITGVRGARWETFAFPAVAASAGNDYLFEARVRHVRPRSPGGAPVVALIASRDRPLRHTPLTVGGEDRWGSLRFDALAGADTWLGRVQLEVLPALPAVLRHMSLVYLALVLYNAVVIGWLLTRDVRGGAKPQPEAAPARRDRLLRFAVLALFLATAAGAAAMPRVDHGRIDLVDRMSSADLRAPASIHAAFDIFDKEIGPERRRVIFAHASSRITWRLTIPPRARFQTEIALDPDAWGRETDGVVFQVAVADAGPAVPLFTRHVNAANIAADRRWIPVDIDFRGFAGRTIDLILTTEPSLPGYPVDPSYDWALWAAPKIK